MELEALVRDAVRAPSLHNSQPWRFRRDGETIEVLLDAARVPPHGDPTGRLSRIACGAAAFNLALGLAVRGRPATIRPTTDDLVVARLTPAPPRPPTPAQQRLYRALPRRHSNRYPFDDTPVPAVLREALVRAAGDEGGRLDLLAGPSEVDAVAALVAEADEALCRDPAYRAEVRVPPGSAGPAPAPTELLRRRDFGGTAGARRYETDPLVGVLSGPGDRRDDAVRAGVALQRVLLTATAERLAVSMFSQPVEVPAIRERLRIHTGHVHPPQLLLRFGYAAPLAPTARRPVPEVLAPIRNG
jgi:nitroreductase